MNFYFSWKTSKFLSFVKNENSFEAILQKAKKNPEMKTVILSNIGKEKGNELDYASKQGAESKW